MQPDFSYAPLSPADFPDHIGRFGIRLGARLHREPDADATVRAETRNTVGIFGGD